MNMKCLMQNSHFTLNWGRLDAIISGGAKEMELTGWWFWLVTQCVVARKAADLMSIDELVLSSIQSLLINSDSRDFRRNIKTGYCSSFTCVWYILCGEIGDSVRFVFYIFHCYIYPSIELRLVCHVSVHIVYRYMEQQCCMMDTLKQISIVHV